MDDITLKTMLDAAAERINVPEFATADPVQFPRRFSSLRDIEITAMLTSAIAWGNRKMICNNCERLLQLMQGEPARYVIEGAYEDLDDNVNIHRTFFARNLKHALRGLRNIYSRYSSLDAYAGHHRVGNEPRPAWALVKLLNEDISRADNGTRDARFLPVNVDHSALKRINMALRWLVRNDGIVDMGVWSSISPAQLFIPLDVHVGDTARLYGLTTRRCADARTVIEITDVLRRLRPDDPVYYDYALFGLGIQTSE